MGNLLNFGIPNTNKLIYRGYNVSNGGSYNGIASDNGIEVYKINGKSVQNGTPTPSTPIEIKDLSISKFTSSGKNLIPPLATTTKTGITFSQTDEGICVNGTSTSSATNVHILLLENTILPSGTYSIRGIKGSSGNAYQLLIYLNGVRTHTVLSTDITFTLTEPTRVTADFYVYKNYGTFNNLILPYQLERGSVCTEYEAPKSATTTTNITLRSLPNGVCDTYEDGVITRRVGVKTFVGGEGESWNYSSSVFFSHAIKTYAICTHFESVVKENAIANSMITSLLADGQMCLRSGTPDRTYFNFTQYTNLDEFKAWLSSNPITVYYELAEPTTETLDIPTLPSYYPITNVYHDSLDTEIEWHVNLHGGNADTLGGKSLDEIATKEYAESLTNALTPNNFPSTLNNSLQKNVYVSPNGDDNNDGLTARTPMKTIASVINKFKGAYVLNIGLLDGEYELTGSFNGFQSLIITTVSADKTKATIKCKDLTLSHGNVRLYKVTLDVNNGSANQMIVFNHCPSVLIYDCNVKNTQNLSSKTAFYINYCNLYCNNCVFYDTWNYGFIYESAYGGIYNCSKDTNATFSSNGALCRKLGYMLCNCSSEISLNYADGGRVIDTSKGAIVQQTDLNTTNTNVSNIVNGTTKLTMATGTDYYTSRGRNIAFSDTIPTSIPNGSIVGVYE